MNRSKGIAAGVTLVVLMVVALSALPAKADSVSTLAADTSRSDTLAPILNTSSSAADISTGSAALSTHLSVPSFKKDDDDKKKKHALTPEPSTWLYFVGALFLILVAERKALTNYFPLSDGFHKLA